MNKAQGERVTSGGVAVVIVNWNGWRDTLDCLDTLLTLRYPQLTVIVVDNDSSDSSVEMIEAWCRSIYSLPEWKFFEGVERLSSLGCQKVSFETAEFANLSNGVLWSLGQVQLRILRSGANLGFAGGCNAGIQACGLDFFDYFWLLNSDTVVHAEALGQLVARAERSKSIGMVGSTLCFYHQPDIVQALGGAEVDPRSLAIRTIGEKTRRTEVPIDPKSIEQRMSYIVGASMLVSSKFISKVGYMAEDYFLYYEEFDWAIRARGLFELAYAPESLVFHKSGASTKSKVSVFSKKLLYKNRIKFFDRFFPQHLSRVRRQMAVEILSHAAHWRWVDARILVGVLFSPHRGSW